MVDSLRDHATRIPGFSRWTGVARPSARHVRSTEQRSCSRWFFSTNRRGYGLKSRNTTIGWYLWRNTVRRCIRFG